MRKSIALLCASLVVASSAHAWCSPPPKNDLAHYTPTTPVNAPEIDPSTAGSALTLLMGVGAIVRGRKNAK